MSKILVTFPIKKKFIRKKDYYFINEHILNFYETKFIKKNLSNTIYSPRMEREKIYKDNKFCKNIYDKAIKILTKKLNNYHKINKSERYWKILIGQWLFRFIKTAYNRYCYLNYAERTLNIKKILLLEYKCNYINLNNSFDIHPLLRDVNFNSVLFSKISNFLFFKKKNIKLLYYKPNDIINKNFIKSNYKKNEFNIRDLIKDTFSIFKFFKKEKDFVFAGTYLPFLAELNLKINFNKFPYNFKIPEIQMKKINSDLKLRKSIFQLKTNNKFEKILHILLKDFFPDNFLENYKSIYKKQKQIYSPKFPKVIFTSNIFGSNDIVNCWIAEKVESGTKYIVGQHGGSYLEYYDKYSRIEYDTCDYFLSWGKSKNKKNKKVVPMFNFTVLNKEVEGDRKNLIIISKSVGDFDNHFDRWMMGKKIYSDSGLLIKNLKKDIQKKTIYKLHQNYIKGYYKNLDFFLKKNKNINIDKNTSFLNIVNNAKLVVFDDYSTGFLQSLNLNLRAICYLPFKDNFFHNENKNDLRPLIENKIVFFEISKLTKHINEYWYNMDDWWLSKSVQEAKNNYCKLYSKKPEDEDYDKLTRFLEKFKK